MKRLYHVRWAPVAVRDLQAIVDQICLETPLRATRFLRRFRGKAHSLQHSPFRGRKVPELAHLPGLPFRELVLPPWRMIYRVRSRDVDILALLDSRRDLEELLLERLTREG